MISRRLTAVIAGAMMVLSACSSTPSGGGAASGAAGGSAAAAKIPVIAYDRLIEDENTFYITFDNKKVGTLMAETLKKLVPTGNYAVILGAETDPNSAFLRSGMTEAGIPKLGDTSGPIKVVF